jgi:ubiquinone/menaquinone biosynthesis C-methylase UbiE
MDRAGMAERRHALVADLSGHVLEVGAGSGDVFAHYPDAVTRVTAVEPEPHLRNRARQRAGEVPAPIEVVDGVADRLPVQRASVDAVVASLVLCTVPDVDAALHEIRRVLRPGGRLRFLEHVRAESPRLARVQGLLDATVWPRIAGGCHTGRDTVTAITWAGFHVDHLDRFLFPARRGPVSLHVIGTATPARD